MKTKIMALLLSIICLLSCLSLAGCKSNKSEALVYYLNFKPESASVFEEVAKKIMAYAEVESVYLMSGVYDLNVVVKGKTLRDVSSFVAKELATIDSVTSTTTHFVKRRYKELDVALVSDKEDDRGQIWI